MTAFFGIYSYITTPLGEMQVAYEPSSKNCGSGGNQNSWKYCIYTAKQGTGTDVIYLLHGRNLDENT